MDGACSLTSLKKWSRRTELKAFFMSILTIALSCPSDWLNARVACAAASHPPGVPYPRPQLLPQFSPD